MRERIPSATLVDILKAAGEATRLRLLLLMREHGEFNVKDLTQILGQSQPRLSRHLKLLTEAGLIARVQEGSSVFYRLDECAPNARLIAPLFNALDDSDVHMARDLVRAEALRQERNLAAQAYFRTHAAAWDDIRGFHAPKEAVEAAMLAAMGAGPLGLLVDLGTGTGRILELFAARAARSIGFDINREMLAHARARLAAGGVHNAQLRLGDILDVPLGDATADAVVIHQVLHFLDEPGRAVAEAVRVLKPGGRLLIVDFAAHSIEAMREEFAHRRLGFEPETINGWLKRAHMGKLDCQSVNPPAEKAGKLTVSLWLAEKPVNLATSKRGEEKWEPVFHSSPRVE